jgi:hypothetical protein
LGFDIAKIVRCVEMGQVVRHDGLRLAAHAVNRCGPLFLSNNLRPRLGQSVRALLSYWWSGTEHRERFMSRSEVESAF